ncbi:type II secretion system protein GspK [Stenotrophomonas sp. PS02298]|uniref:general secretion pathway protein GspK n=1 Tax=Stenotrophomonas sp. PS02298 TaxID=2991424 RepID=UPI00249BE25D|nr:type II secretion system protein GspK [Stenotrophomonas sp. PS02298]
MRVRGAALVLVLWVVALLTTVIAAFALTARVEHLQGRVTGDLAGGEQVAHAGIDYALSRMRATPTQPSWHADGRPYRWQFDGHVVELRVVDESGKVDLNKADLNLLQGLLRALGMAPDKATRLAGAIVDWRDVDSLLQASGGAETADYQAAGLPYGARNAPFDSISELQRVLGMEPALFAQLAPLVTVYGSDRPSARFAAAPVLTAMGLDAALTIAQRERADGGAGMGETAPMGGDSGTYSVESKVQLVAERQAVTRAVVRLNPGGMAGAPYTVLQWEQGAMSR